MTVANKDTIKENNIIIFSCDMYRDNDYTEYDGHVLYLTDKGAEVVFLEGYKSRNELVPWDKIIAKVDKSKPYISLMPEVAYSGHFVLFDNYVKPEESDLV